MTDSEYIKDQIEMIREHWFPDHKPFRYLYQHPSANELVWSPNQLEEVEKFSPIEIESLVWRNPANSNYLVQYFLHRATLFVTGDIGHAIYRWSQAPAEGLEWIAKCDYSYFAEKIEGIERGAFAHSWNPDILKLRAQAFFKENRSAKRKWFDAGWDQFITSSREEWHRFLWDNPKLLGNDYTEHEAITWGEVPNNRCIGHWLGLRLAFGVDKPTTCHPEPVEHPREATTKEQTNLGSVATQGSQTQKD